MSRSQRHLREQRGIDSNGVTAEDRDEPSRVSADEQAALKIAFGYAQPPDPPATP